MKLECEVHHASVGQAKSDARNYDLVLVSQQLTKEFTNVGKAKIVGLVNLLSEDEIRTKVEEALK
jgi:PTS system ascorbate-specific IIB component